MNKLLTFTLATAASAAFLAQPVLSRDGNIVVTPGISQEAFVEKVSRDLDHQLIMVARSDDLVGNGIAIVRFTRDRNGEPTNLSIYRNSGKKKLDRLAMRAVTRLNSLDAVPDNVSDDQLYQANIVFASNRRSASKLYGQLAQEEAARIAASKGKPAVFAFGSSASAPGS